MVIDNLRIDMAQQIVEKLIQDAKAREIMEDSLRIILAGGTEGYLNMPIQVLTSYYISYFGEEVYGKLLESVATKHFHINMTSTGVIN